MALRYTPGARVTGTNTTADDSLALEPQTMVSGSTVRAIHCNLSADATSVLSNITRIRLFAGGPPMWDCTVAQHRALLGFYGKKAEAAATGGRFTIPLSVGGLNAAAPAGKLLRLILSKNATMTATTLDVGYSLSDDVPDLWHTFLSTPTALAAGANTSASVPVPEGGTLLGFTMPTANVTLLRLHSPVIGTPLDFGTNGQILESQELSRGTTVSDPIYFALPQPIPAIPGTRFEVSTNSSFAASSEFAYLKAYNQGAN